MKVLKKIMVVLAMPFLLIEMGLRDVNTLYHSWTTATKAYSLSKELGLNKFYMFFVGLCHDFGKIDLLRTKKGKEAIKSTGKLTDEQFKLVKTHQNSKTAKFVAVLFPEVELHHEKIDGSGYNGISELSICAQVIGVADVYSALKMKRSYKAEKSVEEVKAILNDMSFDKNIVKMC